MIYTSYFARIKALENRGIICVSVANSTPHGVYLPRIHEFVPPWELVDAWKKKTITWEEYTAKYIKQLEKLDPLDMRNRILSMGDDVALLCWEKLICHRFIISDWLNCGVQEFVP